MKFEFIDLVLVINLDAVTVLAIAILLLLLGFFLKGKWKFIEKYCIPTPVVGGMLFAIICFVLDQFDVAVIKMDTVFMSPFMLMFFATIGLGASGKLLIKGGKLLLLYWMVCAVVTTFQNVVSVGFSFLTGISPMFGVMMGSQTLMGGHGGAAAFGGQLDSMGYMGSTVVGMAAATYGVVTGSLFGGPLGRKLIVKYNLTPVEVLDETRISEKGAAAQSNPFSLFRVFKIMALVLVGASIGTMIATYITTELDFVVPSTMGAMLVGAIIRNINDKWAFVDLDIGTIGIMGEICLDIFLTISMMSLALSQLIDLALPMLLILVTQVIILYLYAYFIAFKVLGSNYDAAVMCAGLMGHGLGATPNSVANMGSITEKYGPSTKAFMIVSACGAFANDLYNVPLTAYIINLLR